MPALTTATASKAVSMDAAKTITTPVIISDTAADLVAEASNLIALIKVGQIQSIIITGTATVTAYQMSVLGALMPAPGVSLAPGGSLAVSDTTANLLLYKANFSLATAVHITNTASTVTVGQATSLIALNATKPVGATVAINDTAANLLAASPAVLAFGTSFGITGDTTVTVAQATTLAALANITKTAGSVLKVVDSAAALLSESPAAAALATYNIVQAGVNNVVTAAQMKQLSLLHGFGTQSGLSTPVTLQVVDTAANMLANLASVSRFATTASLTGTNIVTAAQAVQLASIYHLTLSSGSGNTLEISDTLAATMAAIQTIAASTPGYRLPSGVSAVLSSVSVANAAAAQTGTYGPLTNITSFSVTDTEANIEAAAGSLNFDSKLTAITITDSSALNLTYQEFLGLGNLLSKVTNSNLLITVTQTPVAAAAAMQANAQVAHFSISDNFPSVEVNYIALLGYSKLVAPVTPLLEQTYSASYTRAYLLYNAGSLYLDSVTVAAAASVQSYSSVGLFGVSDTAAAVSSGISGLQADTKLSSITISGGTTTNGTTLDLTGLLVPVTVNLGADNTASVSAGLNQPTLSFITPPDVLTISTDETVIDYGLAPSSGVLEITNFTYGLAELQIDLKGAASSVLVASDTTVGGVAAISIYSSNDPTHGVVLLNSSGLGSAASVLASHVTFSQGIATVA